MNFLLDTCVLSEFLKKQPNKDVIDWVSEQFEESLYLSVLTIGEIKKGISRLPDSKRKAELVLWLEGVARRYEGRMLPVSLGTANIWGELKADMEKRGRMLPVIDSLIAATALEHDLTIVTRNVEDFAPAGVNILNLWR
jgi:toxin FitB